MANCCEYSPCEELNTIRFMKDLVNATPVRDCFTISAGTSADTCCDGTDADNYVPRYSMLTGGIFANVRSTNDANPNLDKNGFTYAEPTVINGCCTGDTQENEALMKSQVGFEYTIPEGNRCDITTPPSDYCNPTFTVTETQTYTRHRFICNMTDGGVVETTQPSVSPKTIPHPGTLTPSFAYSGGTDGNHGNRSWSVTYTPYTVSGLTKVDDSACISSISSKTTVNFDGYGFGFTVTCPDIVPCEGGVYTIVEVSGVKCQNDLKLDIEYTNIEDLSTSTWEFGNDPVKIEIPQNNSGKAKGFIKITPTVNGIEESGNTVNCEFERQQCGWTPSFLSASSCSVLTIEGWTWENPNRNEKEHKY